MDFVYYIVRKRDMVILDGYKDMVGAINAGQSQDCACLILQACVITEVGQDQDILSEPQDIDFIDDEDVIEPDIVEEEYGD